MMTAVEARAIIEEVKAEEVKKIREKAEKLCERYENNIKYACAQCITSITVTSLTRAIYEEVINIFTENGYKITKLDINTIKVEW